jgi:hypothetical protein
MQTEEIVDVSITPEVTKTAAAEARCTERMVPYKQLKVDYDRNPRRKTAYTIDSIGWLARNILTYGLHDALVVSQRADGTLWILKGHLRHAAIGLIRTLGLPEGKPKTDKPAIPVDPKFMEQVKCSVYKGLSLSDEMDLVMDHGQTTPLDRGEKYLAVKRMRLMGFSQQLIADKLQISRSAVSKLDWVAQMPQFVEDALLAEPKLENGEKNPEFFLLTEPHINTLNPIYVKEQRIPGARIKVAGSEFKAKWEEIVAGARVTPVRAMSKDDIIGHAGRTNDPDLRDLLEGIGKNDATLFNNAYQRLSLRLGTPVSDPVAVVIKEGIANAIA